MVVVGELVTNGVVHTGNDIRLRTSGADGAITIEVTTSPRPAGSPPVAPRTTAPDEEGRGMGIVAALCQDVWVHNGPAGRRVVTCSLKLG
jgi:anti-sigma regulatory factor (Ser/Thr protein kinase)